MKRPLLTEQLNRKDVRMFIRPAFGRLYALQPEPCWLVELGFLSRSGSFVLCHRAQDRDGLERSLYTAQSAMSNDDELMLTGIDATQ